MDALMLASMSDPSPDDIVKIIAVSGGLVLGFFAILFSLISGMVKTSQRERTRREVAAYVAEGSMTADEGERLLKAGRKFTIPGSDD
ncbi:MAG: hypothetical protein ACKVZJ_13180 [Phycisphaerales bacterium]